MPNPDDLLTFEGTGIEPEIEVRSESAREIGIRFMAWNEVGETEKGLEMFVPGAFDGTDPTSVVVRMEHEGPPAGRGTAISQDSKGAILVARAAPTARGDELMTLAKEGYYRGASPMYAYSDQGTTYGRAQDGRRVAIRNKVDLREVSLTWRPTYKGTEVLYARSQEDKTVTEQAEYVPAPVEQLPAPAGSISADPDIIEKLRSFAGDAAGEAARPLAQRLAALEARAEAPTSAVMPDTEEVIPAPHRGQWVKAALTLMDGGDLPIYEKRALADNISSDNPGFIPVIYTTELIGVIDSSRPFLQTTRRIDMPDAGLQLSYPRITQRPLVAEQETEKTEVASRKITTDRLTADVRTFAGAGDISIQLLRRSSPQFLDSYLELLAEAYASVTENAAVDALLAASPTAGTGTFDPAAPGFGEAFENAAAVGRTLIPDTMWMSTTALVEFMDAVEPTGGGGRPLYPNLAGLNGISGGDGAGRRMSLQPVWTPALDDETVDIVIGPSRGFAWGEEGTFTLTADVPGRLGRDVALAGFMVFVPLYPAAFTTYVVAT